MKDTLRIELHRGDRTYRSGEPVRGEVIIHSDRGDACGTIHLGRFWRTHGRGNSDRGGRKAMLIHEGPLDGPPPYRVPFEFEAPGGPFTYHGSLLNVDHYVEARVDIPGLFDPGLPEEFVLVPGVEVDPPHPELLKVTGATSRGTRGCRVMVGALMVLFGFFTLPFGLVLMIPGLFLAFPMLWRALAGAKIGEVTSGTGKMIVAPGRTVRIRVGLRPRKARAINAATAVLRGREIVVSGKGSDRRVHMHEIHSREVTLSGPRRLTAGQKATLEAELEIPDDGPYTFASKHNQVTWDVRVSVDIPAWPDWSREHKVVVWAPASGEAETPGLEEPNEIARTLPEPGRSDREGAAVPRRGAPRRSAPPVSEAPPPPDDASAGASASDVTPSGGSLSARRPSEGVPPPEPAPRAAAPARPQEPAPPPERAPAASLPSRNAPPPKASARSARAADPSPASARPADTPSGRARSADTSPGEAAPAADAPTTGTPALAAAVRAILEKKSFGGGRDPLIRRLVGGRFTFDLEVDLVKHTFGAGPDPVYRHGRTVTGSVAGTRIPVEVRFPADRNDEIEGYRRGTVLTVTAEVVDWEKLSEKAVLEA